MKILIWFACLLLNSIIQTMFKYAGVTLGGIPTAVLLGATIYLAFKLCQIYDKHIFLKEISLSKLSPIEFIKQKTPAKVLENCEALRGKRNNLEEYLKGAKRERLIKRIYIEYLIEEYRE